MRRVQGDPAVLGAQEGGGRGSVRDSVRARLSGAEDVLKAPVRSLGQLASLLSFRTACLSTDRFLSVLFPVDSAARWRTRASRARARSVRTMAKTTRGDGTRARLCVASRSVAVRFSSIIAPSSPALTFRHRIAAFVRQPLVPVARPQGSLPSLPRSIIRRGPLCLSSLCPCPLLDFFLS